MSQPEGDRALFLGVDGGGTKTTFLIISAAGEIVAAHVASNAYHLSIGLDGLSALMREGVATILGAASIAASDLTHSFFGLPAYGEDSRLSIAMDAVPASLLGHDRYACGNDMISGWAGSLAGADGISITAGTGSIGYGERASRSARAGGWGESFSDEGSAYWIATRGLNIVSRMSDGRLPKGPLHPMLMDALGAQTDLDLAGIVNSDYAPQRERMASLSKFVTRAALKGDTHAVALFDEAGEELAQIAHAIRTSLGHTPEDIVPISYSGGVFRSGDLILNAFSRSLERSGHRYALAEPAHPPSVGAALYAAKLAGFTVAPVTEALPTE